MIDIITSNKEIEILYFIIPKILVATICGAIIGWDRESKNKVAGLRTNILICVGSTLFTTTSIILSQLSNSDPTRILSTIVTGIGFIGAGVILNDGNKITGMTTASFIWIVSAIGIICGLGCVTTPIIITIGLLLISKIFERVERLMKKKDETNI